MPNNSVIALLKELKRNFSNRDKILAKIEETTQDLAHAQQLKIFAKAWYIINDSLQQQEQQLNK